MATSSMTVRLRSATVETPPDAPLRYRPEVEEEVCEEEVESRLDFIVRVTPAVLEGSAPFVE